MKRVTPIPAVGPFEARTLNRLSRSATNAAIDKTAVNATKNSAARRATEQRIMARVNRRRPHAGRIALFLFAAASATTAFLRTHDYLAQCLIFVAFAGMALLALNIRGGSR